MAELANGGTTGYEYRPYIDRNLALKEIIARLGNGTAFDEIAGIIDQHVEPAESGNRLFNESSRDAGLTYISLQKHRFTTITADVGRHRLCFSPACVIVCSNAHTSGAAPACYCCTDSATGPGDKANLASQIVKAHGEPPT
jgi:hypothetical protein